MLAGSYFIWFAAQVVSLLIVLYFLLRWHPGFLGGKTIGETVNAALDARAQGIQDQLDAAERSRREAARIREEAAAEVVQARTQADEIVTRAQHTSEAIQQEMVARAREEKDRIVRGAAEEIDYERRQAEMALRRRAADIVVDAASQIVRQNLQPDTDRRLINDSIGQLRDTQ
jgi:F-type H+-transporting ATPase subunit b